MRRSAVIDRTWRRASLAAIALGAAALLIGAPSARAVKLYWTYNSVFRAPFDLPFSGVTGLATSPDGAFVYVGTGGKVIQYTTGGVWVRTWSAVFGEIGGLATDTAGDVFVADKTHGQVQVFDKNEKHVATWSVPGVQQVAADAQGHVFLLVSVVLGWVVDVRSYTGVDEGAWSAVLPGSFREVAYTPGRTTSIRELAADPSGNVFLAGISTQNLEGEGEDCHTLLPKDQYEYWDPLESGEVARYSRTGEVTGWGWLNNGAGTSCWPPYTSLGQPLGLAVAPDDHNVWVDDYTSFQREMATQGSSFPVAESVEEPCALCGTPHQENIQMFGPEAFDCHGNLFVGAGGAVVELIALPAVNDCPSRLSQLAKLTLSPAISLVQVQGKKKGKKSKALDFQAGCTGTGCSVSVLAQARVPHCQRANCTIVLAHGRFKLKGGAHTFALTLTRGNEALLGVNPRLPIQLSARLLRNGHPFGKVVLANGGHPLLALPAVQMSLSCPAQASLGAQVTLSGSLALAGAHTLNLEIGSPGGQSSQQIHTNSAGAFTASVGATSAGPWTFVATYAGDRSHAASGAGCGTYVLPAAPPPSHKKGPPPPPPAPVETKLELTCRKEGTEEPFTGKISPALAEAPITITYKYKSPGGPLDEKVDQVKTGSEGTFSDQPKARNQRRPGRQRPSPLAGGAGLPRSDFGELRIRALRLGRVLHHDRGECHRRAGRDHPEPAGQAEPSQHRDAARARASRSLARRAPRGEGGCRRRPRSSVQRRSRCVCVRG